ncbi:MAG: response regulator transcription factor [Polyangiaceae bacterium]
MQASLLLVEDNGALASSLAKGLGEDGFLVHVANNGEAALRTLHQAAAVILDLGLPDMDGMQVLRTSRQNGFEGPILILTARDAVASRVEGLEAGADDYLVKPFAYEELLARVRALVRRTAARAAPTPAFSDLAVASDGLAALVEGRRVSLSPREHVLLRLLLARRGDVLSRQLLLSEVFGYQFDPGTNIVDVHIAHLRKKLGERGSLIQTIRGSGYRLKRANE